MQGIFFTRTRIAPTPSGFLHLGNVLSFALTAALARKTGASVLLRIDDLDRERVERRYVQDIFDTLAYMEIPWDEGPQNIDQYDNEYSQVHRMPLYEKALQQLKDSSLVFGCDCSRSMLTSLGADGYTGTCRHKSIPLDTPNINWRLYTNYDTPITVKTITGNTLVACLPADMYDPVIRKKDGYPAYQLASVCDDLFFGVDLVVRGEDLFHSTLAQQYLASAFGRNHFSDIIFYHHPLLKNDGKKLAKSAGAVSIQYLRAQGKYPADIYAMIAKQLEIEEDISSWQTLTDHLLARLAYFNSSRP